VACRNIGDTLNLNQHADTNVRADARLFARQEQIEYGVTDECRPVQFTIRAALLVTADEVIE
jgi:hypothetical protein